MEFKIGKTREEHVKKLQEKVEKLQTPKLKFLWLPKEVGYERGKAVYRWLEWVTVSYPHAHIGYDNHSRRKHLERVVSGPLVFHTGVIF